MFDFVGRNKRLAQIVMALIAVPFLFFGVDYYFRGNGPQGDLASVGDVRISAQTFNVKLNEQQNMARQQLGDMYDPAMFNTPEARFTLLSQMVNEALVQQKAASEHFQVSPDKIREMIAGIEAFHEDGKFSPDRYKQVLLQQNMTPAMFENLVRSGMLVAPVTEPLQGGEISAQSTAERYYMLSGETRDVAMASLDVAAFTKQVKVSDEEVEAYYKQSPGAFQSPETVSLDYVTLSRAAIQAKVTVTEDQVREAYERDKATRYAQPESREAAHILIAVAKDAKDSDKEAARKKAEDVLNKAKATPDQFAALAKEYSQDPGSAAQGGELGVITAGGFTKPFADAVLSTKENSIIGPVETEYGYHIVKVTVRPAQVPSFDSIKSRVEADLKQNEANDIYAKKANDFVNQVHEQTDSFDELSKRLEIPVSHAEFLSRLQVAQLADGNQRFSDAVFASDALRDRQNTDAIDVGNDTLMAARVVDYKPAALRPLDDVKADIRKLLESRAAFELARQAGEEKLAQLQQGKSEKEVGLTFEKSVSISRQQQQPGFTSDIQAAAFRVEAGKLPAYLGAPVGQTRYTLYRVEKTNPPEAADPVKLVGVAQSLDGMRGQQAFQSYLESLRQATKVTINQQQLDALPK